jgi:hypothetical protein
MAPPAAKEAPEEQRPGEHEEGEDRARRQQAIPQKIAEKCLKIDGADPLPVEEVVSEHVSQEKRVEENLESNAQAR